MVQISGIYKLSHRIPNRLVYLVKVNPWILLLSPSASIRTLVPALHEVKHPLVTVIKNAISILLEERQTESNVVVLKWRFAVV